MAQLMVLLALSNMTTKEFQPRKHLLIKNGVVAGLMHNRETAQKFNAETTGNARAEDFRVEPIIRMRCTYMAPRDHSFEELIEDVKARLLL